MAANQAIANGKITYFLGSSIYCGVRKFLTTDGGRISCPTEEDRHHTVPLLYSQRLLLSAVSFITGPSFFPLVIFKDIMRTEASMRGLDPSDFASMQRDEPQNNFIGFFYD